MTFYQLEVMEMIIEKGSFKAAARHLNRTQPTLSVAIKNLEAEFDLQIFSREDYRPKLTEEGQIFYQTAKKCLDAFRHLEVLGKELGTKMVEPKLSFIIDPLASFDLMAIVFDKCLREMKPTELVFRSEILSVGEELLRSGVADFAIASQMGRSKDIESVPLERVTLLPVISRTLMKHGEIPDVDWLRERPQIIVTSNKETLPVMPSQAIGVIEGGKHCFVTDHAVKRRMILEGFGWGGLAHHEVGGELESGRLIRIPELAVPSHSIELCMMRSRMKPMGPVARNVWARMLEVALAEGGTK